LSVFAGRRKRVLSLAAGKQVVATTGANVFWLTDFWGAGAAMVCEDRTVVVTSRLEEQRALDQGREVEVVAVGRWAEIPETVGRLVGRRAAIVDEDVEYRAFKNFDLDRSLFLEARRTKDEVELDRIAKASGGLDRIFEALRLEIKPGRSEWEVAAEVMKQATLNGLTPSGSDSALSPTIIASGENGALPHCELTDRRIREGDFVVADIFFRYQGYNSDETRTFAVGKVSREMKRNYDAVLEAQEDALELVREGIPCRDVNGRAVKTLRKHGLDKHLNHAVGHGVGIDIHEFPRISKDSKETLAMNDIVTDEPGVYFKGRYGIRIEDTVKTGREPILLTRFTKEMLTVG
jgi:Xaa-Pro aminopeptidase/Xaa-Pro dipeptidase